MFLAKTLLLAGTLGAVALASPATAGERQTLHLRALTTQTRYVDLTLPRASLGDEQVASGTLVDDRGRRSGTFGAACTVVGATAGRHLLRCDGWASLADGELTFAGLSRTGANRHTLAITGGTGSYRTARGEIKLRDVADRETDVMVLLADGSR